MSQGMHEVNELEELIEWVQLNHDHHRWCEGDDDCCADSTFPYVNSIVLVEKIRELIAGQGK